MFGYVYAVRLGAEIKFVHRAGNAKQAARLAFGRVCPTMSAKRVAETPADRGNQKVQKQRAADPRGWVSLDTTNLSNTASLQFHETE